MHMSTPNVTQQSSQKNMNYIITNVRLEWQTILHLFIRRFLESCRKILLLIANERETKPTDGDKKQCQKRLLKQTILFQLAGGQLFNLSLHENHFFHLLFILMGFLVKNHQTEMMRLNVDLLINFFIKNFQIRVLSFSLKDYLFSFSFLYARSQCMALE